MSQRIDGPYYVSKRARNAYQIWVLILQNKILLILFLLILFHQCFVQQPCPLHCAQRWSTIWWNYCGLCSLRRKSKWTFIKKKSRTGHTTHLAFHTVYVVLPRLIVVALTFSFMPGECCCPSKSLWTHVIAGSRLIFAYIVWVHTCSCCTENLSQIFSLTLPQSTESAGVDVVIHLCKKSHNFNKQIKVFTTNLCIFTCSPSFCDSKQCNDFQQWQST